jgi:hypothetical protein
MLSSFSSPLSPVLLFTEGVNHSLIKRRCGRVKHPKGRSRRNIPRRAKAMSPEDTVRVQFRKKEKNKKIRKIESSGLALFGGLGGAGWLAAAKLLPRVQGHGACYVGTCASLSQLAAPQLQAGHVPGGGATRAKARLHARVHGHRCYCVVRALPVDTVYWP